MRSKKLLFSSFGVWFLFLTMGGGFASPPIVSVLGSSGIASAAPAPTTLEYVGADTCFDCHDEKEGSFAKNIHSKASAWEGIESRGCETCHGPGSAHADSDGDVLITNPATLETAEANKLCLSCHNNDLAHRYWKGSEHERADVSCVSCHSMHKGNKKLLQTAREENTCFKCHAEQRTYLYKRSHHPLRDSSRLSGEGKMTCSSCHNAHGTQSEKLISANSINDKCYECHREKQAPVLWEHSPVKENCLNCHNPHGSNYVSMLIQKRPRLCQQCHEGGQHQTVAGEPITFLVYNRACSNCHAQVHGSNNPAGVYLKR